MTSLLVSSSNSLFFFFCPVPPSFYLTFLHPTINLSLTLTVLVFLCLHTDPLISHQPCLGFPFEITCLPSHLFYPLVFLLSSNVLYIFSSCLSFPSSPVSTSSSVCDGCLGMQHEHASNPQHHNDMLCASAKATRNRPPPRSQVQKNKRSPLLGYLHIICMRTPNWLFLECQEAKFSILLRGPITGFLFSLAFASDLHVPQLGFGNKGPNDLNCFNCTQKLKKQQSKF